jgi:hypothetical protein
MDLGNPPTRVETSTAPNDLFKGNHPEEEQKLLREEMRQRLHPISCRICRQELSYLRDVGRFPLEESEVQNAYHTGRGYRFLLNVWWGRVADHLPLDLKEMPAVSSYYRHMSFHLGIRTEREAAGLDAPEDVVAVAQSGAFTSSTEPLPKFPVVIPVPVPPEMLHPSIASDPRAFAAEDPAPRGERSVVRMARRMSTISDLSTRSSRAPAPAERETASPRGPTAYLGNAARTSSASGGYAMPAPPAPAPGKRRRE